MTRRTGTKHDDRVYPLTGILVCENCQSPFRGQSARKYAYYKDSGQTYGKTCKPAMIRTDLLENDLIEFFASVEITDEIKAEILEQAGSTRSQEQSERDRARLKGQLDRAKKLYLAGDLTDRDYEQEKAKVDLALSLIRPAEQPSLDLEQAAYFLTTFGKMLAKASPIDRKRFFRTVLEEVYVENRKIVAIRPKSNYYDLLCMSAVRPNGDPSPSTIRVLAEYETFD